MSDSSASPPSFLSESALDSHRFGLRIFRGLADHVDSARLFKEILANEVDIAIVRTPAGSGAALQRLGRYGMHPIHADTLVYYRVPLTSHEPQALRNEDLTFAEARASDIPELNALVVDTFEGYVSHYHANPSLEPTLILAGYAEWAASYLSGEQEGRTTWIARRDGAIVAFACCQHDGAQEQCEGVLFGVHPDHSGGGIYGDLIRYAQSQYQSRGYRTMAVSTQIWNVAVQKVWAREGFFLDRAYDTFHINAMLSSGETRVDRELAFSHEQVAQFAAVTGDVNPVHLDDDAARRAGFDSRISHGMLAGGELSRIFGTEIPGAGTLFLRADMVFLKPIYPLLAHTLQIRYPWHAPPSGHMRAVATIRDQAGSICLLCYSDLLKKH